MKCEEIQQLLFEYMTRELGQGRSDIVREHIRKCDKCRKEAAEIQAVFDVLRTASKSETGIPEHLSEDRRARIFRAFTHPIINWIERHHVIVSIIAAITIIVAVFIVLRGMKIARERVEPSITVTIGPNAGEDRSFESDK